MLSLIAGLTLGALLPLQDAQSAEQARRTADAARAITREFGLSNWSDKLIQQGLARTTNRDAQSELLLARCDVLSGAASKEFDLRKRLQRRAEAGKAYVDYLATGPGAGNLHDARLALARTAFAYGADLNDLFHGGELADGERATLVGDAEAMFTPALQAMNAVLNWVNNLTDPDERDGAAGIYNELSFYRALTFLNWAKLYDSGSLERSQYSGKALEHLEAFAIAAPPGPAAIAYKHIADAYTVAGSFQDAEDYYVYVIESAVPEDPQELWPGAPQAFIDRQMDFLQGAVQDAYLGLLQMFQESAQLGRIEPSLQAFYAWADEERVLLNPAGYRVELLRAGALIEIGRVAEAIEIADSVASDNPRSILQLEANAVMSIAIAAAPPDAAIPLDILYQAAEGSYFSKDYWGSVDGFRALIPRLASSADAAEYGGKAYFYLGASWNQLGFPMLAGLAHETGYLDYESSEDDFVDRNVQSWVARSDQLARSAAGDQFFSDWSSAAITAQTSRGSTPDRAVWLQAERQHKNAVGLATTAKGLDPGTPDAEKARKALASARDQYLGVPTDSRYHEPAKVEAAICEFEAMAFDPPAAQRALAAFDDYVHVYLQDPANAPRDNYGRKNREEREPVGVFYLARTHRALAKAGENPEANWRKVLEVLEGFPEKFPRQIPLSAAAHGYRIDAHLALGDPDPAESEYVALKAMQPGNQYLVGAAYKLFRHFDAAGVPGEAKAAYYIGEMNTFTDRPQFANLRKEGNLRLSIGEPDLAEQRYTQALDAFGDQISDNDRLTVRMSLVEALLQQRKIGLAVPIIDEVYAVRPLRRDVKQAFVKVKGGFLIYADGSVTEVPGEASNLADPEAAAAALVVASEEVNKLIGIAKYEADQLDPPISYFNYAPWWEAKLSQTYLQLLRGRIDGTAAGKHQTTINSLEFQAPELGGNVPGAGERIAKCFQWLKTQS